MFSTVMLDFYGTLAHATQWLSLDLVLAEHGYELPDQVREQWWSQLDGVEHLEHSASRDHYVAWQRDRLLGMLAETDVHPGEYELIVDKLQSGTQTRVLEAYPEAADVLAGLRRRGVRLAVCSNWDWDLHEAIAEAGLAAAVDVVVSSAWVGARKPHPRIYAHALAEARAHPDEVLFVGDTWGPDVVGPRAVGMTPLYLQRDGHWPDPGAPDDPPAEGVLAAPDLRALLDLVPPSKGTS